MGRAGSFLAGGAFSGFASSLVSAAVMVGFDTHASYDTQFVETANGSTVSRASGGYLVQPSTSNATALFYNPGASGGTGGGGGTTFASSRAKFGGTATSGGFTVQADIYSTGMNQAGVSFGFYVKANDGAAPVTAASQPTAAYAGLFRLYDNAQTTAARRGANFRLYDTGDPNSASVGNLLTTENGSSGVYSGALPTSLAASTWYTIKLDVIDRAQSVDFTPSIWTQGGTLIHRFATLSDSSAAILGAGQVGLRIASSGLPSQGEIRVDNFGITTVPEPTVLTLGAIIGATALRRRR
jgi:hypothetical protein